MPGRAGPLSDEERMRAKVERLFGRPMVGWAIHHHPHAWQPPTDVHETETAFTILVEVAGMRQEDFAVNLDENLLTITGARPNPAPRAVCHQMEIHFGEFRTDIYIAAAIDADGIEAHYADGFLHVLVPKARARRIAVVPHDARREGETDPPNRDAGPMADAA